MKEPNISIYFIFPPVTQWCSTSDVLFTGGRGVSDFSVLKYYWLNINYSVNILNECLCILIDCSELSKIYYNVLFGSSTRDRHARRRIYRRGLRHFRYMSISVQMGGHWTISVHDDFGTYEINFGTRDFCSTVSVHRYVNFST